jgi:hypothetical protein
MAKAIVYTSRGCGACAKLLAQFDAKNVAYEERRVDLSQAVLDEARIHGDMVPMVVWPDGNVELGFEGFGCFL